MGVDAPLLGVHAWRQTDTAAVARNFHEGGYRLLRPQIDWRGDTDGAVEMEFPLYPFLVALAYGLTGASESVGRLISILFSLVSLFFIYRIARRLFDSRTGLWATAIAAFLPLNIFYGRAFMPEPLHLATLAAGFDFFLAWLDRPTHSRLVAASLFFSLALLTKLTALWIAFPLLVATHGRFGWHLFTKLPLWGFAILTLAPVLAWYTHAHSLYRETGLTFGIWAFGEDKWGNFGMLLTPDFWNRVFIHFLIERHLAYFALPFFVLSLVFRRGERHAHRFLVAWLLTGLLFIALVARGNAVHEYYQLPFIIPVSILIGRFLASTFDGSWTFVWRNAAITLGLIGMVGISASLLINYWRKEDPAREPMTQVAKALRDTTAVSDLIVAIDDNDPTLLYHAHRKGWHAEAKTVDRATLENLRKRGARVVAGTKTRFQFAEGQDRLNQVLSSGESVLNDSIGFIVRLP
ncbi:MAG: glycosyltransferase family 39 protein [Deltaproteobacteria bacterium]|nr:glycosyltransferase family 39 protein [Deltaproteobacteria bacterium]